MSGGAFRPEDVLIFLLLAAGSMLAAIIGILLEEPIRFWLMERKRRREQ